MNTLKILVLGAGSIGQRHISNLLKFVSKENIFLYDIDKKQQKFISKKFKIIPIENFSYKDFDCVFICTPPINHVDLAIDCLKNGCHVFIEKPLSTNFKRIKHLQTLAKRKNLLVFVGYVFRFNSSLNEVQKIIKQNQLGKPLSISAYYGQYLPDWRPTQDYKKTYSAKKSLGGGIIHDASHEIDYLTWLFGNPRLIQSSYIKPNFLSADVEGIAEVILHFKPDLLGTIHLDFIRREYKRSLDILFENGIVSWSLKQNIVKIFNSKKNIWKTQKFRGNLNDMYLDEIKHVLLCIKQKKASKIISLENGINSNYLSGLIFKAGKSGRRLEVNPKVLIS